MVEIACQEDRSYPCFQLVFSIFSYGRRARKDFCSEKYLENFVKTGMRESFSYLGSQVPVPCQRQISKVYCPNHNQE
jgi:hypothetical protein